MGKGKTISQLPREITLNILARLPVKSLLRSKCVCKPWRTLISDPQFAKLQLTQSQKHSYINPNRILLSCDPPLSIDYEAYNGGEDDSKVITTQLEYPSALEEFVVDLVGSCHGLVCLLLDDGGQFIIWNPCTGESRALPKPNSVPDGTFSYGLGYDFLTDDYKLLRVGSSCSSDVEVFTLKTNVWRRSSDLQQGIELNGNGIFLNGSLHFLATQVSGPTKIKVIVSFNLAQEKIEEVVAVPDHLQEKDDAVLGVSGDCFCIFFSDYSADLYEGWVMKEFGVKSSWTRLFSNPIEPFPGYKYWQNALCYTKSGKVVIDHDGWELLLYDPKEQTIKNFAIEYEDHYFHPIIYSESLVSPNFDDAAANGENPV
ncbi:hypothetical protein COLO4_24613 [Corchorus olitorius]|uniref:F-box domain-containing protein n=1 Tax=Corchorus olitorius TaxID=93759 RepID=A0A1R3I8T4_9ROSI|nr:hypothetical protein COLO4_24613 [Corchorus olitorius]